MWEHNKWQAQPQKEQPKNRSYGRAVGIFLAGIFALIALTGVQSNSDPTWRAGYQIGILVVFVIAVLIAFIPRSTASTEDEEPEPIELPATTVKNSAGADVPLRVFEHSDGTIVAIDSKSIEKDQSDEEADEEENDEEDEEEDVSTSTILPTLLMAESLALDAAAVNTNSTSP